MSSFAGYCAGCGKPVMHKTLFGTLHVCIDRDAIELQQAVMNQWLIPTNSDWLRKLVQAGGHKPFKKKYGKDKEAK